MFRYSKGCFAAFRHSPAWLSPHVGPEAPSAAHPGRSTQRLDQLTGLTSTLAQFPFVRPSSSQAISLGERIGSGLLSQRYVQADGVRERRFAMCRKCGHTTITIGFDGTPSARLGMAGRCGNNDFSHHAFQQISEQDYLQLRPMKLNERLTWFAFHR